MIKLGEKIKSLRKQKNISQEVFANYLGVSFQAVSKWENGLGFPLRIFLAQLLRPIHGQAVVCPVPWVKADNVMVAFHIFVFLVFSVWLLFTNEVIPKINPIIMHNKTAEATTTICIFLFTFFSIRLAMESIVSITTESMAPDTLQFVSSLCISK